MQVTVRLFGSVREASGAKELQMTLPDGASVAESMKVEGVDLAVLYGPGYDMWIDGIDPDLQAGMARAYNRWAEEMRETSYGMLLSAGLSTSAQRSALPRKYRLASSYVDVVHSAVFVTKRSRCPSAS